MRASEAKVLEVLYYQTNRLVPVKGKFLTRPTSFGNTNGKFIDYIPGKIVRPHEFSTYREQCSGGIHFFTNIREAKNY